MVEAMPVVAPADARTLSQAQLQAVADPVRWNVPAGLVTTSRRGRWVDYALAADTSERMRARPPGAPVTS